MNEIKIVIVEDEQLIIEGLKLLLEHDDQIKVVATARNGVELFDLISEDNNDFDIILLDISMPEMDGLATLQNLNSKNLPYKVIMLTSHYNDGLIIRFLDEGVSAFLAKNEHPDELIKTIKKVHETGFHINNYLMQLIRDRRLINKNKRIKEELSQREIEILELICQEFTNKEIAEKLYISQRTVEGHRNRILEKTHSKNTAGIVLYAIENNVIDIVIQKY